MYKNSKWQDWQKKDLYFELLHSSTAHSHMVDSTKLVKYKYKGIFALTILFSRTSKILSMGELVDTP